MGIKGNNMKNRSAIIWTTLLIFAACTVRENPLESPDKEVIFYATHGDSPTKTVLQEDGTIKWQPQDKINLFYRTKSYKFTSTNTSIVAKTTFRGALDGIEYADDDSEYWAVCPYNENNYWDGDGVWVISMKSYQNAGAGSFDASSFISIAKTNDYTLHFYNVFGGVKFSVTEPGVKSVTFKGRNNEILSGQVKVGFDENGLPTILDVFNPSTEITLKPAEGSFQVGKWYYITSLPVELSNGYTLKLRKEDGTFAVKRYLGSVKVKRSVWGELTAVDSNILYGTMPEYEIHYKTSNDKAISISNNASFGDRTIISNVYENGEGIISFDGPLKKIANAFTSSYLTEITLPESLTTIGTGAFNGTSKLRTLHIPSSVVTISEDAVLRCSSLESFTGKYASEDGQFLIYSGYVRGFAPRNTQSTDIVLPSNANRIGKVFSGSSITSIELTNVNVLASEAFRGCHELTDITFSSSLISIGTQCFEGCDKLSSFHGPLASDDGKVLIIDNAAVAIVNAEDTITIPEGVTTIAKTMGCWTLQEKKMTMYLPKTLKSIDPLSIRFSQLELYCPMVAIEPYSYSGLFNYESDYYDTTLIVPYCMFEDFIRYYSSYNCVHVTGSMQQMDNSRIFYAVWYPNVPVPDLSSGFMDYERDLFAFDDYGANVLNRECIGYPYDGCQKALLTCDRDISRLYIGAPYLFEWSNILPVAKIWVPSSVTSISFSSSYIELLTSGLQYMEDFEGMSIYLMGDNPPEIGYLSIADRCWFYVPESAVSDYKAVWWLFADRIKTYKM